MLGSKRAALTQSAFIDAGDGAIFRTRVPTRRLQRAEKILRKLGLKPADAVNLLLAQIEIRQGLPFEVSTQPKPLLSADEQAAAWTEAFGAY